METGTPTVAVLMAGRPLILPEDVRADFGGLLLAYLPGSEGGAAVADVLYGAVNPSGKLPFSWPQRGDAGEVHADGGLDEAGVSVRWHVERGAPRGLRRLTSQRNTSSPHYTGPMPRTAPVRTDLTFEEYLKVEEESPVKHEFVHGQMFMLAGASDRHNRIAGRLYARLLEAETGSCQTFFADIKVRTPDGTGYYPDLLVTCDEDDNDAYVKRHPYLVAEVLSGSTEAVDRGEKLLNYQKFGSLQGYVLLSQDEPRAEVYRRVADGWRYEVWEAGKTLTLPCVGLELPVHALYEGL